MGRTSSEPWYSRRFVMIIRCSGGFARLTPLWYYGCMVGTEEASLHRERERERATARRVELVSIIVSETSHFQPECASLSFSPDGTTSFIKRRLFPIVCLRESISLSLSLLVVLCWEERELRWTAQSRDIPADG